jgi:cytochrome bd-type quinol oxidase subunit 1
MKERLPLFVNRYVLILFVIQIVGWVGLVATFEHSPGPVVRWIQMLPVIVRILLLPLAIFSIPALGIALAVGWVLSLVGRPPETIAPLLIAHGDILVFASAYAVAVSVTWAITRITGSE